MKTKEIKLNIAQMMAVMAKQKNKSLELGRGTGKSTILSHDIVGAVRTMPRATGVLVGTTFIQILSRTWPSTKEGLEMFGFIEDVHYVVGKNGNKLGFNRPFQAPNKWHNVIHFYTGFILVLVSLEDPNSGRGLNSYIVFGDEAALLDHTKLMANVSSTNRAVKDRFKGNPLLNAEIYASSTPMNMEGKWFTNLEDKAFAHPDKYFHLRANAMVNLHNISPTYFEDMKERSVSIVQYEAEILNIRPKATETSFYPQLNPKKHYYTPRDHHDLQDFSLSVGSEQASASLYNVDIDPMKPLIVSVDWGSRINSMTVAQDFGFQFRIQKEFWVKNPRIIDDLILEEFVPYFKSHIKKEIHLYYDRNGNSSVANSRITFSEQAINLLVRSGWKVVVLTPNTLDPPHDEKFKVINLLLKYGGDNGIPSIQISRTECPDTIVSMENAPAKESRKGTIEKDKSSERKKTLPQQFATHLSDTVDLMLYWRYKDIVSHNFGSKDQPMLIPIS